MKLRQLITLMLLVQSIHSFAQINEDSLKKTLKKQGFRKEEMNEIIHFEKSLYQQAQDKKNGVSSDPESTGEPLNYPVNLPDFMQQSAAFIVNPNLEEPVGCSNLDFEQGNFNFWTGRTARHNQFVEIQPIVDQIINGRQTLFGPGSGNDLYGGFPKVRPGSQFSVMLGNNQVGAQTESLSNTFTVTPDNKFFTYYYAVVMQDPGHPEAIQPRFTAKVIDQDSNIIDCSYFQATAGSGLAGFVEQNGLIYKPWATNIIDLSAYLGQEVTVIFQTYDCSAGGHFGYAYIDGTCLLDGIIVADKNECSRAFNFSSPLIGNYLNEQVTWNFGDNTETSSETSPLHTFQNTGTYLVSLTVASGSNPNCNITISREIQVIDCGDLPCESCVPSFAPTPGDYIVSAWVKEKGATPYTQEYTNSYIEISYTGNILIIPLYPGGKIIDGWQRIEQKINVPASATQLIIKLKTGAEEAYFDDIRFFPVDGSMMSYVYDPITLRLMAELDERNYSTLYEYDEEGKLIRVKKETEKGIMTIQENRDNLQKK